MPDALLPFIEHARQKGMDAGTIFALLRSAGWKDQEIATAIAAHELAMPIPQRARSERVKLNDPETGEPYSYVVRDDNKLELCATFTTARNSDSSVFWNHPAGRHCFTINVLDPPPFY